ncbi:MAG: protein kinase [Actinomyces sp.]|jgi:serine/threonine-protein kinase|nr:serine/threonine protein kinase [Actinomyces sp.]MCI1788921.1 protein kinase [Actinomyces sp.]MCI1830879.1 protein kinase [Actinomyces sp.]
MTQDINRNAAGTLLGSRYTLLTPIAQGGMGEVWKARDRQTGHLVAAKVMRPELSGQEHSLSRLRLEARNSMRVQHRNIAAVLDHGEDDGRGWIVMELVEGRPLTDYLRGGARLAVRDLIPLLMQVAMALNAAAEAGVVHRDIKPANILIRDDGVVKLTDFGISRTLDQATLTAAGMVMGTAQYLPPEQAMGETATSAGDLYALGVIAYECVAGHRPFTGATQVDIAFAHVNDKVPDLPADVPAPFATVVMHLMEKDPARRPASGAALARELVSAAHALGLPVAPHPLPAPPGTAATQETAPHPVVPPVEHTPRRSLPPSLLAPVPLDEDGAPSARHGRHAGHPADERPTASTIPPVTRIPTSMRSPEPAAGSSPDPDGHRSPARSELAQRLQSRAERRDREDARSAAPRASAAPPRRSALQPRTAPSRAAAPSARREAAGGRPWKAVTRHNLPRTDTAPVPAPTRFNRSKVAPPVSVGQRIGRGVVIAVITLTVLLVIFATIQNRFGSFSSIIGAGAHIAEEAGTWTAPWTTV